MYIVNLNSVEKNLLNHVINKAQYELQNKKSEADSKYARFKNAVLEILDNDLPTYLRVAICKEFNIKPIAEIDKDSFQRIIKYSVEYEGKELNVGELLTKLHNEKKEISDKITTISQIKIDEKVITIYKKNCDLYSNLEKFIQEDISIRDFIPQKYLGYRNLEKKFYNTPKLLKDKLTDLTNKLGERHERIQFIING